MQRWTFCLFNEYSNYWQPGTDCRRQEYSQDAAHTLQHQRQTGDRLHYGTKGWHLGACLLQYSSEQATEVSRTILMASSKRLTNQAREY